MKKFLFILLSIVSMMTLVACANNNMTYYFATSEVTPSSTWVYYVILTKQGNKIVDAEWDAYNIKGDAYSTSPLAVTATELSKYEASKQGLYNMSSDPTKLKWHEQADLITTKLVETQNINERIPVPAGATVETEDFYTLAEKALANGPVEKGNYKDGFHFITNRGEGTTKAVSFFYDAKNEQVLTVNAYEQYSYGVFVVVNGTIKLAYLNTVNHAYKAKMDANNKIEKYAYDHDNNPETAAKSINVIADYTTAAPSLIKTKNELAYSYGFSIPNGSSALEYFQIATILGDYLVENQSFPELTSNNNFDSISGVTIKTNEFVKLLDKLSQK